MKCMIVVATALAVASAQFPFRKQSGFGAPQAFRPAAAPQAFRAAAPAPARASSSDQNANIVRYDNEIQPDGGYSFSFETDNGIAAQAQGTPRNFGGNPPLIPVVAQGNFVWTSPEGVPVAITYTADENGYQPQGDVLPTPPPTPPQILRALEYNARNAPRQ